MEKLEAGNKIELQYGGHFILNQLLVKTILNIRSKLNLPSFQLFFVNLFEKSNRALWSKKSIQQFCSIIFCSLRRKEKSAKLLSVDIFVILLEKLSGLYLYLSLLLSSRTLRGRATIFEAGLLHSSRTLSPVSKSPQRLEPCLKDCSPSSSKIPLKKNEEVPYGDVHQWISPYHHMMALLLSFSIVKK
jgi:hypothetical protein